MHDDRHDSWQEDHDAALGAGYIIIGAIMVGFFLFGFVTGCVVGRMT